MSAFTVSGIWSRYIVDEQPLLAKRRRQKNKNMSCLRRKGKEGRLTGLLELGEDLCKRKKERKNRKILMLIAYQRVVVQRVRE